MIYFLQSVNGGPIKIGHSIDVTPRAATPWPLGQGVTGKLLGSGV